MEVTVSYWADIASIKAWKAHAEHQEAQRLGHQQWYKHFKTRIGKESEITVSEEFLYS